MSQRSTLTEAETRFIQSQRVGRLATVDEQGIPYLIPICYAFDGTHFYSALDEKPKSVTGRKLRRVRNIERNATASLLIDQYDDDWSRLGYVLIIAHAELIEPSHDVHSHALQLLRARYIQYVTMALEHYPVIMLTPEQVTSWGPSIL